MTGGTRVETRRESDTTPLATRADGPIGRRPDCCAAPFYATMPVVDRQSLVRYRSVSQCCATTLISSATTSRLRFIRWLRRGSHSMGLQNALGRKRNGHPRVGCWPNVSLQSTLDSHETTYLYFLQAFSPLILELINAPRGGRRTSALPQKRPSSISDRMARWARTGSTFYQSISRACVTNQTATTRLALLNVDRQIRGAYVGMHKRCHAYVAQL